MKRLSTLALFCGLLLVGSPMAWARVTSPGYSTTESSHTVFEHVEYEYYFNNSGSAMASGSVVVIDRTGTGVNVGVGSTLTVVPSGAARSNVDVDATDGDVTNVGTYITTTTTADNATVVGVVDDDSCADQTYCRVQVYGPRLTRGRCSSDPIATGVAVGTAATAGTAGGGTGLGFSLSTCRDNTNDNSPFWLFIRPGGND